MRILNAALIALLFSQHAFADNPGMGAYDAVVMTSDVGRGFEGKLANDVQACEQAAKTAHTYCLTELNPKIQAASGLIGTILSGALMMKSMSESCQEYSKALRIAEMALTAYNGMCSAAQMNCESTCGETKATLGSATTSLNSAIAVARAAVPAGVELPALLNDQKSVGQYDLSIGNKYRVCQGYKMNLAGASVGLMNIVKQSTLSGTCSTATTVADCTKNPSDPSCLNAGQGNVDCSKNENQNQIQCICQRAPNTQGCPGATGQAGLAALGSSGNKLTGESADKIKTPDLKGTDSMAAGGGGASSAGGGGLAGGGGGGAGGGMGSGQNKAGAADGKKSEKALNTNILSGYDGGGGGGGSRGGGGRSDQPNSAYNAYLPGGAKDPTRGLASKTFGNGEVTAAGSKSNWEKISERYKDNKPTLMGP